MEFLRIQHGKQRRRPAFSRARVLISTGYPSNRCGNTWRIGQNASRVWLLSLCEAGHRWAGCRECGPCRLSGRLWRDAAAAAHRSWKLWRSCLCHHGYTESRFCRLFLRVAGVPRTSMGSGLVTSDCGKRCQMISALHAFCPGGKTMGRVSSGSL